MTINDLFLNVSVFLNDQLVYMRGHHSNSSLNSRIIRDLFRLSVFLLLVICLLRVVSMENSFYTNRATTQRLENSDPQLMAGVYMPSPGLQMVLNS